MSLTGLRQYLLPSPPGLLQPSWWSRIQHLHQNNNNNNNNNNSQVSWSSSDPTCSRTSLYYITDHGTLGTTMIVLIIQRLVLYNYVAGTTSRVLIREAFLIRRSLLIYREVPLYSVVMQLAVWLNNILLVWRAAPVVSAAPVVRFVTAPASAIVHCIRWLAQKVFTTCTAATLQRSYQSNSVRYACMMIMTIIPAIRVRIINWQHYI